MGNALEVVESIETLRGQGPQDLTVLSVLLAARMVLLAGRAGTLDEAERLVREALASGAGLARFRQMVVRQGGDPAVVDDPSRLALAPGPRVRARAAGRVCDRARGDDDRAGGRRAGRGPGHRRRHDRSRRGHPGAGDRSGSLVRAGEPVLELIHRDGRGLRDATELARQAIELGGAPPRRSRSWWGKSSDIG